MTREFPIDDFTMPMIGNAVPGVNVTLAIACLLIIFLLFLIGLWRLKGRRRFLQAQVAGAPVPWGHSDSVGPSSEVDLLQIEERVLRLVNQERLNRDLKPLRMDASLLAPARSHSCDMANRGYFAHDDSENNGPADRIVQYGSCSIWGENLARIGDSNDAAARAVCGWMRRRRHRGNILGVGYERTAVGVARRKPCNSIYITQLYTDDNC